jgi:hypothetical protein
MRSIGLVVIASVCAFGAATPAHALAELQNCDTEKDPTKRMVCLQAHISHLEETLLSLSAEVVGLRHELKEMLAANAVYKVQYVGKGGCLNFSGDNKPPVVGSCDSPDSWKLVVGAQSPPKQATPKPGAPGSAQTPAPDAKTGTSPSKGLRPNPPRRAQRKHRHRMPKRGLPPSKALRPNPPRRAQAQNLPRAARINRSRARQTPARQARCQRPPRPANEACRLAPRERSLDQTEAAEARMTLLADDDVVVNHDAEILRR